MSIAVNRDYDMLLGKKDLEEICRFEKFPIYIGTTTSDFDEDVFEDMQWMISRNSGMVQLGKIIPDKILYKNSHNSGYGKIWCQHYQEFSKFLFKNTNDHTGGILEIGGGNGILNATYEKCFGPRKWLIVEPSGIDPVKGVGAKYLRDMWDKSFRVESIDRKYDTIVHTHVMEHVLDINSFMEKVWDRLDYGQRMIFSVPNLKEMLKRCYTNALNFEHTYLITEEYIEYLLQKYGFHIVEKKYFRDDHSIFYACEKCGNKSNVKVDFIKFYKENLHMMRHFVSYQKEYVNKVDQMLETSHQKAYLFGAHIFSQYLIFFGLNTSNICGVLDNDVLKQKKRLYGTQLMVYSPEVLREENNPIVILKVASYAEEIKSDIIVNINRNTRFFE